MTFRLFIIGNGFDLFHGLPSSLNQFSEYLRSQDSSLHSIIEEYLHLEGDWNTLELSLADFDVDLAVDEASNFLQSYSAEDWSDAYHHDYQYELDKILGAVSSDLKRHFTDWIYSLDVEAISANKGFNIISSDIVLSFNYTDTLELLYNVDSKSILYIHGSRATNQEMILGHAWEPSTIPNFNNIPNPEDMDTRVMEGNELLNSYFKDTFKPTSKIVQDNQYFFDNLYAASQVVVIGHSLSIVDQPYFEEVVKKTPRNMHWLVTYHNDEEQQSIECSLKKLGITNFNQCKTEDIALFL
ncbi:bacteriophage abortive infection AbiH family protein [Halomonas sp. AOP12-C2-37]|uniref:bacteriophage abortive infection AbiH family protein n=1 Tax=unclassified Halomonas TaxID=2609666 RepID=UPI004034CBC7